MAYTGPVWLKVVSMAGVISYSSIAVSQTANLKIPIIVRDTSTTSVTVRFGVHPGATHCTDRVLGEYQLPPDWCFPGGCYPCAAFVDNRFGNYECFGEGMLLDLRPYQSRAQVDTYRVWFATGCPGSPVTLRWPLTLSDSYDSARIQDAFGGMFYNVNMFERESLVVTQPEIFTLLIRAWGPHGMTCQPPQTRTWLNVSEPGVGSETLWFGFDPAASCLVDTQLCEYASLACDPSGYFCTQWLPVCGYSYEARGLEDYRASAGPAAIDTFRLKFQTHGSASTVVLRWSQASVAALYDSVILKDTFGGTLYKVRMDLTDSLVVGPPVNQLHLVVFGQKTTSIGETASKDGPPLSMSLAQNYPNPFNPETRIQYTLPKDGLIRLVVFDVLGQEVTTLVHHFENAGTHGVQFDASGLAGGVYFYRLYAAELSITRKLLVAR